MSTCSTLRLADSHGLCTLFHTACAISRLSCRPKGCSGGTSRCLIFITRYQAMFKFTFTREREWPGSPAFLTTASSCISDATWGSIRIPSICVSVPNRPDLFILRGTRGRLHNHALPV